MFYTVDQYGVRFSEDKTELIMAPRTLSGDYVIPETVMEIHTYAFDSCKNLERITLPNTISKLGIGTFRCCENLKTVIFNSSIVSIAHSCFASCYSLQEIQLPRTVVKIDKQAFFECRSLDYEADFVFATVQTLSKQENLEKFPRDYFNVQEVKI